MKIIKNLFCQAVVLCAVFLSMAVFYPENVSAVAPSAPYVSPDSSYVNALTTITITIEDPSAFVTAYTTDGSDPILSCVAASCVAGSGTIIYSVPFDIDSADGSTVFIKAISSDANGLMSDVVQNKYDFDKTAPLVSGVEEGVIYGVSLSIEVSDANLSTVTLNGNELYPGDAIDANGMCTLIATDLAGNSTTIHFTIALDDISPLVTGVEEGGIYDASVMAIVTDDHLDIITLNGEPYTSGDVISTSGVYTLIATDLAGNSTTVNFTVVIDDVNPVVTGVAEGVTYDESVIAIITDDNLDIVTLNDVPYDSGSVISDVDDYTLIATDLYGNSTTVHFSIIEKVVTVPVVPVDPVIVPEVVEKIETVTPIQDAPKPVVVGELMRGYVNPTVDNEVKAEVLGTETVSPAPKTQDMIAKKDDDTTVTKVGDSNNMWLLLLIPITLAILMTGYWYISRDGEK